MCYIDTEGHNKTCEGWERDTGAGKQVLAALIVLISAMGLISTALMLGLPHLW